MKRLFCQFSRDCLATALDAAGLSAVVMDRVRTAEERSRKQRNHGAVGAYSLVLSSPSIGAIFNCAAFTR
jgi:hypothetical protein